MIDVEYLPGKVGVQMKYDNDYVLCECELEPLQDLVAGLEKRCSVTMIKQPSVCLTMVRAEDSLEKQEFYLGEALTTECEVSVDGLPGYGVCLGEEPVRSYCLAVVDALIHTGNGGMPEIKDFVEKHRKVIADRETEEYNLVLRTQVDFKFMEQE